MECNKEEALRAKELAEKKLIEKDLNGARRFASKAQTLFPELQGLSQLVEIINVFIASEKQVDGETDWYGILGLDPSADDDTIRKQYRKMALALHPDKNKSVGADGAFKLLSDAWSFLSDKYKKAAYDQRHRRRNPLLNRMGINVSRNNEHTFGDNSRSPWSSGTASGQARMGIPRQPMGSHPQPMGSHPQPMHNPSQQMHDPRHQMPNPLQRENSRTFWTSCPKCRVRYEYQKSYLNCHILCPSCKESYYARETFAGPHTEGGTASPWPFFRRQQSSGNQATPNFLHSLGRTVNRASVAAPSGFSRSGSFNTVNVQQSSFVNTGGSGNTQCSAAASAHFTQPARPGNSKRGSNEISREDLLKMRADILRNSDAGLQTGSSSGRTDRPVKRHQTDEHRMTGNGIGRVNNGAPRAGAACPLGNVSERLFFHGINTAKNAKEFSQLDIHNVIMGNAKKEIQKKLIFWSLDSSTNSTAKVDKDREKRKPKVNGLAAGPSTGNGVEKNKEVVGMCMGSSKSSKSQKSQNAAVIPDSGAEAADTMTMSVPDPDFHDFDKERTEKSFAQNQVWAAYDDDDGMPRFYALIHDVISTKPFTLEISWLNSKSNAEFGPLNWVNSGFRKTSGEFRIGKHEVNKKLNSFSHRVKWTKAARGVIQIFPRKGDIWALYRNWSPDWNECTADEEIHEYVMVEVLEDYNELQGVVVAPLVKAAGFKSVFCRHSEPSRSQTIPRTEMFRFSHQVPTHLLTGEEASNVPKGGLELDPAALPLELLQVIKIAEEVGAVETTKTPEEVTEDDDKASAETQGMQDGDLGKGKENAEDVKPEEKPLLSYSRKIKGRRDDEEKTAPEEGSSSVNAK